MEVANLSSLKNPGMTNMFAKWSKIDKHIFSRWVETQPPTRIQDCENHVMIYLHLPYVSTIHVSTLQGTNISPQKWHFEDDFPFPKVGYVSSLEGKYTTNIRYVANPAKATEIDSAMSEAPGGAAPTAPAPGAAPGAGAMCPCGGCGVSWVEINGVVWQFLKS